MNALFGINIQIKKAASGAAAEQKATAGTTKERKKQLAAFDEMNKLQADTTGDSGSGGGGGSGAGYTITTSTWKPWKELQDAIDSGEWVEVGRQFALKVNSIFEAWDAEATGRAIGKKVDMVVKIAFGFLYNLNWTLIGTRFAQLINGVFD